ncbi:hypothetical protein [Myxococcus sp. CA040A]|uniref:hypothetical protein n=1 Tax=Myxococcus sp. CA040A TaxID=2741738 RepID=UPI00157AF78F|nr:hypothetical protein [Myxococcus sp. CA040A]NTX05686.1 hypothetical protein [Myxococcus sp. CA040A]
MWNDVELRDLPACAARLLDEVRRADGFAFVREQAAEAEAVDEGLVTEMTAGLVKSFGMYRQPRYLRPEAYAWEERDGVRTARIRPLSALLLYWAGGDVSPYVPQVVWGTGLVGHHYEETASENVLEFGATNFDSSGGFDLGSPGATLVELAEDEALHELDVFVPLKKLLLVRTLQCAHAAVRKAVKSEAFRELPREESFRFFATPGHDEPSFVLPHEP